MKPNVSSSFLWGGQEVGSICSTTCLYIMAGIQKPAQEEPEELSDSDFESPVCWRRQVHHALPTTPGESEAKHQETEGCIQESENEGQAEGQQMFPYNVAEFPYFLEEDEALEEAIQRSLLEESDRQSEVHISSSAKKKLKVFLKLIVRKSLHQEQDNSISVEPMCGRLLSVSSRDPSLQKAVRCFMSHLQAMNMIQRKIFSVYW
ncbi:membrane dipeptidase [Sarotherodon galilaeus]